MVEAVFLDLDGCLIESGTTIALAINHGLGAVGQVPEPPEALRALIGPPLLASYEGLLRARGADPGLAGAAIEAYREVFAELSAVHTTVVPGVATALAAIAEGHRLAVVTSKPADAAIPLVHSLGLDRWVEATFGPALDALTEPKAVQLRLALAHFGLADRPGRTVMVGDRHHDIDAGQECGTGTVGVTWGFGSAAELTAADHIVDDPAQLLGVLGG